MITYFEELSERIDNIDNKIASIVEENKDVLLSINKDQLLLGRDSEGNILSPSYIEDPYFKTKEHAESYARMKYALESKHNHRIWFPAQYPDKDRNTPNLIVRGNFQDEMYITTGKDEFKINSTYIDSNDIDNKYKGKVFGIAPRYREYFYIEFMKDDLKRYLYGL